MGRVPLSQRGLVKKGWRGGGGLAPAGYIMPLVDVNEIHDIFLTANLNHYVIKEDKNTEFHFLFTCLQFDLIYD